MKSWLAPLLLLAACVPEPSPLPPVAPAAAAAIPEGRTPAERRELFQSSVTLYDQGDLASAQRLFTIVAGSYPELADYALRHLAKIAEKRNDAAQALSLWQTLLDRFTDSIWKGEAELALGRARLAEANLAASANLLAAARQDLKDGRDRATAFGLAIDVARRGGDLREARALAGELRTRYPQSAEAIAAREQAWAERETALANATTAREEGSLLLKEGQSSRALELLRLAENRFRDDTDFPELLWLEASALSHLGERDAAEETLERIHGVYGRHPAGAKALFRLGSLAWNRDDDETALRRFGLYARQYPGGAQAPESLYAIGRIHQEAGRYPLAAQEFARLAKLYPKSSLASEARFRVGWCQYRAGNRAAAAETFGEIAEGTASERASALYWRSRAANDDSILEDLLREFPESYYAALAEKRLGQRAGAALADRLPATRATVADSACSSNDGHRVRFEELRAMNLARFARGELAAFQDHISGCDGYLIQAWVDVEGYRQSVDRALHAAGCGIDSGWIRFCYPLGFWDMVRRETADRGLDPYLVAALIRQESLFDAEARSSANAIGLMQILPATAERLAAETNRDRSPSLVNPAENLALGTVYLRKLLDRYGGNLPRALAAYNAGEAAVDKWQRRYPDVDDDEFVESISYRETRGYVKRVLQNRRIYRALYEPSAASPAPSG